MQENHRNKRISKNVAAAITQVLISGVVLFTVYRYLYDRLGVELIGVWSLVLAATSVSRIGDLGLSAGVVRYVAQALGRGDTRRAADVVQTVALTLGVFMAILLVVSYPLFAMALKFFIPERGVPPALSILPYALTSLWFMMVAGVFSGGLDGCLRTDLRSLATGLSHVVYLGMTLLLVPTHGLGGVALAQLSQSLFLLVLAWAMLRGQLTGLPLLPLHWRYPVLKAMMGYGVNFQIISVMSMLYDPTIKALMSRFGGLEALGFYEMANKLILQGRAIIVEASRVMVPAIATLQEHDSVKATQFFMTSYRMTFYVAVLFYGLLGTAITTISVLWLGNYQATFIHYALLLNVGWFVNTLNGPAYFSNLGSGRLRANMISHAIVSLCSAFAGFVLGLTFGGSGVVVGTITGLVAGSMYLLISHLTQADLYWPAHIIPQGMTKLLVLGMLATLLSNIGRDQHSSMVGVVCAASLAGVPLVVAGWCNHERMVLVRRVTR